MDIQFKQLPDRQGDIPYEVIISGDGFEKLNEFLGTPGAFIKTEVDGETLIVFELDATNLSSGGLDIGFAPELSFTVEGLRVVATNGKKNSPMSVSWKRSKGNDAGNFYHLHKHGNGDSLVGNSAYWDWSYGDSCGYPVGCGSL